MLEAHQRNGYCTEAVKALIAWAFGHPAVQTVIAHTLPELAPSIRVMEKCGLSFAGEGPTEDGMQTIRLRVAAATVSKQLIYPLSGHLPISQVYLLLPPLFGQFQTL